MVHHAGGKNRARWQAEAIRGKGDCLYQPLLVMMPIVLRGEMNRASDGKQRPIRGKGDRLYQLLLVMVHRAGGENRALDGKQRPLGVRATAYINRCW